MSQVTSQPGMGKSSLQPGVSGESRNAPYGPKSADVCPIEEVMKEVETYYGTTNCAPQHEFAVGAVGDLTQSGMGESSLKP